MLVLKPGNMDWQGPCQIKKGNPSPCISGRPRLVRVSCVFIGADNCWVGVNYDNIWLPKFLPSLRGEVGK